MASIDTINISDDPTQMTAYFSTRFKNYFADRNEDNLKKIKTETFQKLDDAIKAVLNNKTTEAHNLIVLAIRMLLFYKIHKRIGDTLDEVTPVLTETDICSTTTSSQILQIRNFVININICVKYNNDEQTKYHILVTIKGPQIQYFNFVCAFVHGFDVETQKKAIALLLSYIEHVKEEFQRLALIQVD